MYSIRAKILLILPLLKLAVVNSHHNPDSNILCRHCGTDVLNSEFIVSKVSPEAIHTFNDTIFNKTEVLIQILPKDFFFQYPVITAASSACYGVGEWSEDELWFSDYRWKPCVCAECGAQIGWIFQELNRQNLNSTNEFFTLILPNIIGESCKFQ